MYRMCRDVRNVWDDNYKSWHFFGMLQICLHILYIPVQDITYGDVRRFVWDVRIKHFKHLFITNRRFVSEEMIVTFVSKRCWRFVSAETSWHHTNLRFVSTIIPTNKSSYITYIPVLSSYKSSYITWHHTRHHLTSLRDVQVMYEDL